MSLTQITEKIEVKQRTRKKLNDAKPEEWDAVNKPKHYNNGDIECIDGIRAMLSPEEFVGYLRGNSLKYRWRYPYKNGTEDLRKAAWYEDKLLKVLEQNG
jgi:hypothetical protein